MTSERWIVVNAEALPDVFEAIRGLDTRQRPTLARRVLLLVLGHLCPETGVVQLDRDEIASRLGSTPPEISHAMTALASLGVIRRERRPVIGRPGSGVALYFVNPSLAWSGDVSARARWSGGFHPLGRRQRIPER